MSLVPQDGDIVFAHNSGIIARAIRFAERHDKAQKRQSGWNHAAVVYHDDEGKLKVIQATAKGVTDNAYLDDIAPGGKYEILSLPVGVDRQKFLFFMASQVGDKYGFLTIVSCALDMYLPDAICLRRANTWICSGLVAGALWFGGYKGATKWPDLYTVTPSQLAESLTTA